jgi:hypothetical protein
MKYYLTLLILILVVGVSYAHMQCPTDIGFGNMVDLCKHEHKKQMSSPRSFDKKVEKEYTLHYYYFCMSELKKDTDKRRCTELRDVEFSTTIPEMMTNTKKVMRKRCGVYKYTYHQKRLKMKRLYIRLCEEVPLIYNFE